MLNQHPIFLLILSFIVMVFIIVISFVKEKFYKKSFVVATIYFLITIALYFFYKQLIINETYLTYYKIFVALTYSIFLIFFISIFLYMINDVYKSNLMNNALKEMSVTAYFIVNKKDKIKDISDSLLSDLGKTKKEVLNKNIFDCFEKSLRLMTFNEQEISFQELKAFYKKYHKIVTTNEKSTREYVYKNSSGIKVAINFIEQPLYQFGRYKGRVNVGEKKSDVALLNVEMDLEEKNKELNLLTNKFINLIELSEEGIFSKNDNEDYFWISDSLKNMLKLKENTLSLKDYYKNIYEDDLMNFITKSNKDVYNLRYRFLLNNTYVWCIEKGSRVSDNSYIGTIKLANYSHFEKTEILELDSIKNEIELLQDMQKLFKNNQLFQLVIVNINDIPQINEKHGRACGNMMLAEYVKKLRYNFMSEHSNVYRIGGLIFAFTITDTRKMELFRKMILSDSKAMDLDLEFGAVSETITVKMGTAMSMEDAFNADELLEKALKALKIAKNPNYNAAACFYKEIKE